MSLSVSFLKKPKAKSDTAVVFVFEKNRLSAEAQGLDKECKGMVSAALEGHKTFKGKPGQTLCVSLPKGAAFRRAVLAGLGDAGKLDVPALEQAGGKLWPALKAAGATHPSILAGFGDKGVKIAPAQAAAALATGLQLRSYDFDKYKSMTKGAEKTAIEEADFVTEASTGAAKAFASAEAVNAGVFLARDLTNEPPNVLYPESYAARLKEELTPLGVAVEIIDDKKMQKLGFGAHLAVGMGSARPPRVVILRWNGTGAKKGGKGPLAFVGKGVTFDTGGISIKPAAGMEEMKMDMGGSAAVAGLIRALATRKAKIDVVGVLGLAENMPSDRAYRPGDIVTSLAGKTIEVLNTDAEGRLVLVDALTYVQRTYKPRLIVDLATLTGAVMVALGFEYAGLFANDDKLCAQLEQAGRATAEKLWRMPLDEAYRDEMKGGISDLKNLGSLGRYGGACSAAGFLEHFIENNTPWAHIDIAGTAWWKSDRPTVPKGGTGFGVRLLERFVAENYEA